MNGHPAVGWCFDGWGERQAACLVSAYSFCFLCGSRRLGKLDGYRRFVAHIDLQEFVEECAVLEHGGAHFFGVGFVAG